MDPSPAHRYPTPNQTASATVEASSSDAGCHSLFSLLVWSHSPYHRRVSAGSAGSASLLGDMGDGFRAIRVDIENTMTQ